MKRHLYLRHFLGAFLLMITYSLITSAINLMLLPVVENFGFSRGAFAFSSIILMIPNLILSPFMGTISSRAGLRQMILFGGVWGTASLGALCFCKNLPQFYLAFLLGGFVYCPCTSYIASVLLNSWFKEKKSIACSIVMAGTGVGGMLWGILVPPLVQRFTFRAGHLFCSALWFTFMLLCTLLVRGFPQDAGITPCDAEAENSLPDAVLPDAGPYKLIRQKRFWLLCTANFSLSLINGFFPHIQAYLVDHNYTAIEAGRVISTFCLLLVVIKLLLGVHFEHKGLRRGIRLPLAVDFITLALLYMGIPSLLTVTVVLFAVNSSLVALTPLLSAGKVYTVTEFAAVWGILSAVSGLGNSVGTPLWGVIYDRTGSYRAGFLIAFVLLALWGTLYQYLLKETS